MHHKFSETDADPHNATRGFFFSHIGKPTLNFKSKLQNTKCALQQLGWLLVKKHPDVLEKGKGVDCADILADPVVRFQRKHYLPLVAVFCFIIPTYMPMFLFGETFWNSFFVCGLLRYCFMLVRSSLVNLAIAISDIRSLSRELFSEHDLAC